MKKFTQNKKLGFSLIELSIVILVIGILVIGISKGSKVISESKLKSAKSITNGSPIHIIDDLALWLEPTNPDNIATGDFDDPLDFNSDLSEGSPISSWRYLAPSNTSLINLTPDSDAERPTYTEKGINGLPAIAFDGLTQVLTNAQGVIPAGHERYTMIAVFTGNNVTTGTHQPFSQRTDVGCSGTITGIIIQGSEVGYFGCGAGSDLRSAATTVLNNNNYIVTIAVNKAAAGDKVSIYLNSKSTTLTGSPANISAALVEGPTRVGDTSFSGSISEIIVFNDLLESSQIDDVQNYLSTKYGIKLN